MQLQKSQRQAMQLRCKCGHECESYLAVHKLIQSQYLMQFLVGLNDPYQNVRGNILMMKPLPSIDQAYCLLLQEEKQRGMTSFTHIVPQSAAMNVDMPYTNVSLHNPNIQDPTILASQQRVPTNSGYRGQNRKQLFCDHCKMNGHTVHKCYKLHGFPPGHKFYKGKKVAANVTQSQDNPDGVWTANNVVNNTSVPALKMFAMQLSKEIM